MKSWGSRVDLADELERELSLSHESARDENEPLDYDDVISLTSSDPAASALLGYNPDEQEMAEDEDVQTESPQISCPAYESVGGYGTRHGKAWLAVGANPRWRCRGDVLMSDIFPAINTQLKWTSHSFLSSIRRSRRNGKSRFLLAFIGSSIPVMRTLKGCVKTAMRRCPCWRDAS